VAEPGGLSGGQDFAVGRAFRNEHVRAAFHDRIVGARQRESR
jgi:hypothetical protein